MRLTLLLLTMLLTSSLLGNDPLPDGAVRRLGTPNNDEKQERNLLASTFSGDGKHLITSGRDGVLRVWNLADGKQIAQQKLREVAHALTAVPRSNTVAVGDIEGVIMLYELDSLKELKGLHKGDLTIGAIVFTPDGKTFAFSRPVHNDIEIRDADGKPIRTIVKAHESGVDQLSLSPDGKTLASTSYDHTIRLWNMSTGEPLKSFGQKGNIPSRYRFGGPVEGVLFSRDGATLASWGAYGPLRFWDPAQGTESNRIKQQPALATPAVFSRDSKSIVFAAHSELIVYDVASAKELRRLPCPRGWVGAVALSPDGSLLANGCADGTILIWDAAKVMAK